MSSEVKINSGNRLIELIVDDEVDLESIKNRSIKEDNQMVKFMNFERRIFEHSCEDRCRNNFDFFRINNNGSSRLLQKSLSEISYILQNDKMDIIHYDISECVERSGLKYKYLIAKAYFNKVEVKNCFICRYHGYNTEWEIKKNPIFCKFLKIICNSNEAASCDYFKIGIEYAQSYIDEYEDVSTDSDSDFEEMLNF